MKEFEKRLRILEKQYKTYDVMYNFYNTTRDDFDTEKIKKYCIKTKEIRYLLDERRKIWFDKDRITWTDKLAINDTDWIIDFIYTIVWD